MPVKTPVIYTFTPATLAEIADMPVYEVDHDIMLGRLDPCDFESVIVWSARNATQDIKDRIQET